MLKSDSFLYLKLQSPQPFRHTWKQFLLKVLINLLIALFWMVLLISRLIDLCLMKPLGLILAGVGLLNYSDLTNPITFYSRKLVHYLLIPASAFERDKSHKTTEKIATEFIQNGNNGAAISNLFITLGGNADYINEESAKDLASRFYGKKTFSMLILSHSDPKCAASVTASELVDNHVRQIRMALMKCRGITNICLYGWSMGGAILSKVLSIINQKKADAHMMKKADLPFKSLETCSIFVDRSFESLTKLTRCTDAFFGYLPMASLIWPLLGWQICPKLAIRDICEKPSDMSVSIYINTARNDDMLGSGKLTNKGLFSSCKTTVHSRVSDLSHNSIDKDVLGVTEYNSCKPL